MERHKITFSKYFASLDKQNRDNEFIIFENILFETITFENPLFAQNKHYKKIIYKNCEFGSDFDIGRNNYDSIEIIGCIVNNITFNKGVISERLLISESKVNSTILIDINTRQGVKIIDSEFEQLTFGAAGIAFSGIEISSNNNSKVNNLKININGKSRINIHSINVEELVFTGTFNTQISIKNCHIQKFLNSTLQVRAGFVIDNIKPIKKESSIIDLSRCEIHHLEVLNSNLRNYETLKFRNSKYTTIVFSNSKWKTNVQDYIYDSIDEHRFLKNKMGDLGNKVDELFFLAYELDAHRQSLKFNKRPGEKTILFLNRWTNNFRLSIWLPLFWFIIVSWLFYFSIIGNEGLSFTDYWGKYFIFINP